MILQESQSGWTCIARHWQQPCCSSWLLLFWPSPKWREWGVTKTDFISFSSCFILQTESRPICYLGFQMNASSWPMFLLRTLNGAEMAPAAFFKKVRRKGLLVNNFYQLFCGYIFLMRMPRYYPVVYSTGRQYHYLKWLWTGLASYKARQEATCF